ncbi:MAG: hypothetical protein JSW73_02615 [Candidatus Woesearchaeota archaeon]|nr:MAG: hypothetical protein JSW73_02615 [Candidatus Woesearchaeota archaeon]
MNIEFGEITKKKIIVLFIVIILIFITYAFTSGVDVYSIINPGPSTWVKQYTNRVDTNTFHTILSTHIQDPYLISQDDLEISTQIIFKDIESEIPLIKGFFVSYRKNNDNVIVKITEDDKLSVLVMSENVNASHFQYFKVYDIFGNISKGHYNITYFNELDQRQIVYVYYEENIYDSILK